MTGAAKDGPSPGGGRLACGRDADELLAQVADGRGSDRDDHQRSCLHCQAALGEYDRLWAPVRDLAAQTVTTPDHVLETALRRIRRAVTDTEYGVLSSPDGVTRISARVVVVTARETAQSIPGVRVALSKHVTGRLHAGDGAGVSAGVAGQSAAVEITVAADYGLDLRRLGERIRTEVAARVRALTDLEPVEVTVVIDDILD